MNVIETLQLPSFEGAQIIAGRTGVENEISSAMVLEATDIENWGKRGQLIISSFYAFEHLNEAQTALFFRTCAGIGIGAVAFKPERLMAQAPERIIALCNDFDLPLIQLSSQVKYEQIMLDIMGEVLDSNLTLLNRFYEVHRHVMALALKQPSIPYVLNTLKNTLHADVSYLDSLRDRRLSTDQARTRFSGYSLTRRDPNPYQTHAYFDAKLVYDGTADAEAGQAEARRSEQALAVRIPSSDGDDYYLIIHTGGSALTPFDIMTVENIVSLLQMEILKQNAIKQKLFFQNNNTVHDLLLDRFGTHERIDTALATLGVNQYPCYEVLLIRTSLVDPTDTDRLDELQQAIRRRLRSMYPGMVYFVNNDRLVFLHNFRSAVSGIDLDAVQLFDGTTHVNRSIRFSDLGVYKLLLQANDLSQLDEYVDARLLALSREHEELFQTLVCLCENSLDYAKTAEQLFVHPKTVRYRIGRVRELSGIDVKDSDDFLQVILASKIIALGHEG